MAEKNVTLILTWAWSQCQKITKWLIKVSAAMATGTAFSWLPFSVLQLIWLLHVLHILTSLHSRAFTPVLQLSQFNFPPYLNSSPHSCWTDQRQCTEGRWHQATLCHFLGVLVIIWFFLLLLTTCPCLHIKALLTCLLHPLVFLHSRWLEPGRPSSMCVCVCVCPWRASQECAGQPVCS